MLALRFHARHERFLLDARRVVELVPLVPLRGVAGAPEPVVGVLDYRSMIVPVIDLCLYLGKGPVERRLSSRILVLDLGAPKARRHGELEPGSLLGLLAERVLEVENVEDQVDGSWTPPVDETHEALGAIRPGERPEQLVHVDALIDPALLASLVAAGDLGGEGDA